MDWPVLSPDNNLVKHISNEWRPKWNICLWKLTSQSQTALRRLRKGFWVRIIEEFLSIFIFFSCFNTTSKFAKLVRGIYLLRTMYYVRDGSSAISSYLILYHQISLVPLPDFWCRMHKLRLLHLHDNPIGGIENLHYLANCPQLNILTVYDTPLSLKRNYRYEVVMAVTPES